MTMAKPKAIDLFCGCGGTTRGLRDAGFNVVAGVEIDPLSVGTFAANHPRTTVWEHDIRKLDPRDMLRYHGIRRGELDLLAGCPPCQSFSTMPRRNGGKRVVDKAGKDLTLEYLRFVEVMLPKVVVLENVPRLAVDRRLGTLRRRLQSLGYRGSPMILNAANYGVPQRRRRMLLIASRFGEPGYAPSGNFERRTVRDAIGHLPRPGRSGDPLHDFPEKRSMAVKRLIASIPKNGGSRRDLGERGQLRCHMGFNGFHDVYGRMAWDSVAPTITGGCINPSKGRFLHPTQNRSITLREAALLQSFPKDYFFSLERGKFAVALMIGNAFPPAFVLPHAIVIRKHLNRIRSSRSPRSRRINRHV